LTDGSYELQPIGWVESSLTDPETAPKQGDEGSPDAWLVFEQTVTEGLRDLQFRVRNLEALDRTPIVDVKPVFDN
jgi:tRNA (Thr-GGU) A37 N-methylase